MDDEITRFNRERWEALIAASVPYSRPLLNLNTQTARQVVDPFEVMGDVAGRQVLCLASGGGQQSVAFAMLGAHVTVLDFAAGQLDRDRQGLEHYGLEATLIQGDMRDLSRFETDRFDVVWHAYSINFIPEINTVFNEVERVIKPGGMYRLEWHNPFIKGTDEVNWNGDGYTLKRLYQDGEVLYDANVWEFQNEAGENQQIEGPREFNHTLQTIVNALIARGMVVVGMWEDKTGDSGATPGTWEHFKAVAPPYLTIWARHMPHVFKIT